VHQVGYLKELNRDARSSKYKILHTVQLSVLGESLEKGAGREEWGISGVIGH